MAKKLDLNKTVYELTQEYPELIEIMAGLGFTEIIKKPMLHSVGKIMTIPKGAKMKNISMMDVVTTLMGKGFELVGEMPDMSSAPQAGAEKTNVNNPPASRTEQLKAQDQMQWVQRMNNIRDRATEIVNHDLIYI